MKKTDNVHIRDASPLVPPAALKGELPMPDASNEVVFESRRVVQRILRKEDSRFLIITGPCSIHDKKAANEYARKLNRVREKLQDRLYILMRVYFEKPRTTIGWRGFIMDPHLDGTGDIAEGLRQARKLLLDIIGMGLPAAAEMLDTIVPQYIADLVTWSAIGARTTESQTHREMASGLSMPVGFKNSTDGNMQIAVDAIESAGYPHSFIGIDQHGRTCVLNTSGNPDGHVILRGGRFGPNYDPGSMLDVQRKLEATGLEPAVVVDCSHANSEKKQERQEIVLKSVVHQRIMGNRAIVGLMLESNLAAGNQTIPSNGEKLKYGISITDECIDWETTQRLLIYTHEQLGLKPDTGGISHGTKSAGGGCTI